MSGLQNSSASSRFTSQNQTTDQRLSNNTVGLVELSDFRKRRAEMLEQQEREAREAVAAIDAPPDRSLTGTPAHSGNDAADGRPSKKKKKNKYDKDGKNGKDGKKCKAIKVSKLSFMGEDGDEVEGRDGEAEDQASCYDVSTPSIDADAGRDPDVPILKSFTKQALRRQAAEREALRKEFLELQAVIKATPVAIPFVFYEGANIPGGVVTMKKGDPVWLFLDRSRKVGARLGVGAGVADGAADGSSKRPSKAQMHWARINVDDLMLVRGSLIIPPHYDFYYFVINKTLGPGGVRVFEYSAEAYEPAADSVTGSLEGADDDPSLTKVVDRRWYERNKHIFPANAWQEFDPEQDYTNMVRRDQGGNAYFSVSG